MKFSSVIAASALALVGLASVSAPVEASTLHVRIHTHHKGNTCPAKCPSHSYCAKGDNKCRTNKETNKCFNPAKATWIPQCAPGFHCVDSKCEAKKSGICYLSCKSGSYCAVNDDKCRTAKETNMCFNPAESMWIEKCAPGFTCRNGKCDYA